jgi:hypothetical protein
MSEDYDRNLAYVEQGKRKGFGRIKVEIVCKYIYI